MRPRLAICLALVLAGTESANGTRADEAAASSVESCTTIESPAERLGCYDHFLRHPAAASKPASSTQTTAPAATAVATPPASPEDAFGFYAAEHPAIQTTPLKSLTAKVADFVIDSSGHQTLTLDNGQSWRLYGADELLARGNSITINRAVFGSFILKTPSGRTYRATRLH